MNILQSVETALIAAGNKIENVLEPKALALWNIAKGAFAQMEAVGIPQLEAATEAGLAQVAADLLAGETISAAVADTAATALVTLGTDAKADINALYTYIGMQIANMQQGS